MVDGSFFKKTIKMTRYTIFTTNYNFIGRPIEYYTVLRRRFRIEPYFSQQSLALKKEL